MKQNKLNSHFKVKKNKRDDSLSDAKSLEKMDLSQTEKKKSSNMSIDTKKLVFVEEGSTTRAKRVARNGDDSFEEPKVVGKRVKLDKKKKSPEKVEKVQKEKVIKTSDKKNDSGKKSGKKKNKRESDEESIEKEDIEMKDLSDLNMKDDKSSESKSTTHTEEKKSVSPEISSFTKSIIDEIYRKKQEREEKMKQLATASNFNYLNYNTSSLVTPKKIVPVSPNNISNKKDQVQNSQNLQNLENSQNSQISFSKINNNFSVNNTATKSNDLKTPSKLPELKLSLKTLEEIKKLKTERQNRFKREPLDKERTRSESSFSLKFKYEELLKEERELLMPAHFKTLLNSFTELDHTLSYYRLGKRQRVPFFDDVKQSIESTYKHKFDFKTFAQILYVAPHFFVYKWEKLNEKIDQFSLIIDIPKDHKERIRNKYDEEFNFIAHQTENYDPILDSLTNSELEERKKVFKNLLLAIVNESHKSFLESVNYPKEFDPFKFKTWHHDFNLDTVPQIPIFEILEKPTIKITSIKEFLRDSDITNSLVKRAVDEFNNNNNSTSDKKVKIQIDGKEEDNTSASNTSSLSKYLSSNFLDKLKAKETAVNEGKNFIEYSNAKHKLVSKVKDFQGIADKLKTIFMMQKTTSVSVSELAAKIYNSSDNLKISFTLENLKNIILRFKEIFPGWLTIFEHSSLGTLVKMDSRFSMKEVLDKLADLQVLEQIENSI